MTSTCGAKDGRQRSRRQSGFADGRSEISSSYASRPAFMVLDVVGFGVVRIASCLAMLGSWPCARGKHRWQTLRFRLATIWLGLATVGALAWAIRQYAFATLWLDDIALSRIANGELGPTINRWWARRSIMPFTVCVAQVPFDTTAEALGLSLNESATVKRTRDYRNIGSIRVLGKARPKYVDLAGDYDVSRFTSVVDAWEKQALADMPVEGSIVWERGAVVVRPGRPGWVVDRRAAQRLILSALAKPTPGSIAIPLKHTDPPINAAELELLREQAERLTRAGVELQSQEPKLSIHFARAELGRLLKIQPAVKVGFDVQFDPESLSQLLAARRVTLQWPAKNATFAVTQGDHFTAVPESPGYQISPTRLAERLRAAALDPSRSGTIDVQVGALPKLKVADVEHLGIRELIGTFTTRHPCCRPRVQNIHRIADLLDGTIVLPGETFSINDTVGPRAPSNGFVMAPSIEDGEMVDTIGGGVSQFATTFYNALLRSGLEILERKPHTYWFERYPMGHEATLSFPKPDLVFRNDTHAGVLIKTSYTDTSVTVRLYGDRERRVVTFGVSAPREIEQPAIERLPNPDLLPDKERAKDHGRIGWSVTTWRTVTYANHEQKRDERKVTYKPQLRRIEVHPCRLRPDEPGYTGLICPKPEPQSDEIGVSLPAPVSSDDNAQPMP
jgi:vancomycin resistance protein YoaR